MDSFQAEVNHNHKDFMVYADLKEHGTYKDQHSWLDVVEDPTFTNYEVFLEGTNKEVTLSKELKETIDKYLVNIYWDRIF